VNSLNSFNLNVLLDLLLAPDVDGEPVGEGVHVGCHILLYNHKLYNHAKVGIFHLLSKLGEFAHPIDGI